MLILAVAVSGKYLSHLKSYGCIYSILVCFQQFMYLLVSFIRINRGAIVCGGLALRPLLFVPTLVAHAGNHSLELSSL